MKPHVRLELTAGVIAGMTPEQLAALQQNIVGEGVWDHVEGPVTISGHGDYLGVHLPNLFVGIERDGYTHS